MRKIPLKIRKKIDEDSFYKRCCITGSLDISIQHCFIYAGRQISDLWALVPLRRDLNTSHPPIDVQEKCKLKSLLRAKELGVWEELKKKYPRINWENEWRYLMKKYEKLRHL